MTADQLVQILSCSTDLAEKFAPHLDAAMEKYSITTRLRRAAFIAQVGHESGRLQFTREIWSPEQCPWQADYEGRADLGNFNPGDGSKFRGRGLIQLTGRANYERAEAALNIDCVNKPELLEEPEYASLSAAWFWESRGLNPLADKGDMRGITKRINGGYNGFAERLAFYAQALKILEPS